MPRALPDDSSAPSRTALGVAWLRAAHQVVDDTPRLLDDPVAVPLLGVDAAARLRADSRLHEPGALGLRSHVVLRSRVAEDRLAAAAARGAGQYVLLGAGYDTFAYRQPAWARALRVVEVDAPATAADKRARLTSAGIAAPPNVAYADVDFERESLAEGLARHGVSRDVPTVFSWLGVTMYLTRPAIEAALATMATFAPGSEVVLTFAPREETAGSRRLAEGAAALGEPWRSFFTPDEIVATLLAAGFTHAEVVPLEATAHWFRDRSDDLPAPRRATIAVASLAR